MRTRLTLLWVVSMVVLSAIVLLNGLRAARIDSSLDGDRRGLDWSQLLLDFAGVIVFTTVGVLAVALLYGWGRRNERRVLAAYTHGDVLVVAGVRNHHPAMKEGWPLHGVSGLGDFSTVIRVTSEGFELLAGIRDLRRAVGYSWSEVESIDVALLDKETYKHGAGAGVDVRIRGFAHPLRFGLVERQFPWVDPMPESAVRDFVDSMRKIHGKAMKPKSSKG
ncbi:MAG: hypothetical protein ACO1N6_12210 [Microcella sp.]